MRNKTNIFLLSSFMYAFGVLLFIGANNQLVNADTTHIVISQVQLSGATANDEFVELYNPTGSTVDLSKWRLTRKASSGGSVQNLVASLSGTIAPKSYFLISHPAAVSSPTADNVYSSSSSAMTTNNTVTLFSDAGVTVIDKVGLGTAVDVETAAFADNPEGGESIVRKATTNSTVQSLFTGGPEAMSGNGLDTDNNATDFVLFPTSLPRNAASPAAQPTATGIPSSTPSPTSTTTPVPTLTLTIVPTSPPTATPIPTATPTTVPTVIPTQIPTSTPTSVPSNTPAPTATKTPTPTPTTVPTTVPTPLPSVTPTPTPSSQVIINESLYANRRLVCIQTQKEFRILGFKFFIPQITCSVIHS